MFFFHSQQDRLKHAVDVLQDIVVPEAQDAQPAGPQESRSLHVGCFVVLTAVSLRLLFQGPFLLPPLPRAGGSLPPGCGLALSRVRERVG